MLKMILLKQMINKLKIVSFCILGLFYSSEVAAQHLKAYQLFTPKGKKTSYKKMVRKAKKADIVLFGEFHNNTISHWLQHRLSLDLLDSNLVFGAEMFEADNQGALDSFLNGLLTSKGLDTAARLWNNYKTDYAPLVKAAKDNNRPFIATNIPRRYASKVYRGDFAALDSLSDLEKSWMSPLPILFDTTLSRYVAMLNMMGGHGGWNLVKAQAIKDATMAYFIYQNWQKGQRFLHFNGAYHSDYHEGIYWYLKQLDPDLNILTISTVSQENIKKLKKEHRKKGDFIIAVDELMTTTY
jgi:uncharacterized iron-regulated protein